MVKKPNKESSGGNRNDKTKSKAVDLVPEVKALAQAFDTPGKNLELSKAAFSEWREKFRKIPEARREICLVHTLALARKFVRAGVGQQGVAQILVLGLEITPAGRGQRAWK